MTTGEISERMLRAVIVQLIRAGKMDESDLFAAADELDAEGDPEGANSLRAIPIHAAAPSTADWIAEKRRRDIRERTALLTPDGGNRQK